MELWRSENHEILANTAHAGRMAGAWDENEVRAFVASTAASLWEERRDDASFPAHPDDDASDPPHAARTLYDGAAGGLWAHVWLWREGFADEPLGWREFAQSLARNCDANPDECTPSFLVGQGGVRLVCAWALQEPTHWDAVFRCCEEAATRPENEMMWAAPGALLMARFAWDATGEERWRAFAVRTIELLDSRQETDERLGVRFWTQDLYGNVRRYIGPVHGTIGVYHALLAWKKILGIEFEETLADAERFALGLAMDNEGVVNWAPTFEAHFDVTTKVKFLVHWCHGAPGMLAALAPYADALSAPLRCALAGGAECVWRAGPLVHATGICHGNAGNALALAFAAKVTGDDAWLLRARAFGLHAIKQSETRRAQTGLRRHGLHTGDPGLLVALASLVRGVQGWPLVDFM